MARCGPDTTRVVTDGTFAPPGRTGTSAMLRPRRRARVRISTSKAKRSVIEQWNNSLAAGARKALYPHWVSLSDTRVTTFTSWLKARFMTDRRRLGRSTAAPTAAREPMARSARASARTNSGVWEGSIAMSASAKAMSGAEAALTPRRARPHPFLCFRPVERSAGAGIGPKRASAQAAVSSVLPSSTTTNSVVSGSMPPEVTAARRRVTPSPKRRASLKAGMTSVSRNGVSPPPSAPEAALSSLLVMAHSPPASTRCLVRSLVSRLYGHRARAPSPLPD